MIVEINSIMIMEINSIMIVEIKLDYDYRDKIDYEYGDIFKNNNKYLIIYEQTSIRPCTYYWFLQTNKGFVKFYERDSNDGLYIKDSIFDTNKDGTNELVAYKHRGGSGSDYKIIYYLNKEGLISKEKTEELNEDEFKSLDDY